MRLLDWLGVTLVDQLLIEIPALQECALDAAVVEGVEDVGNVAAVDVVFARVDDDGAGDGELFADEAAAGGAFGFLPAFADDAAEVGEKLLVLLFAEEVAGGWHIGPAGRY